MQLEDSAPHSAAETPALQKLEHLSKTNTPHRIKAKLSSISKIAVGALLYLLVLGIVGLILAYGGRVAAWLAPWINALSALSFGIIVPICLVNL